jgi:ABC-type branched-subunit amino acid transport system ATPase component
MSTGEQRSGAALLRVEHAGKSFRGVAAVVDANLAIGRHQIHGLIGPNGAGKTTLINIISGYVRPDAGHVYWGDREITGLRTEQRARLGLVRTFQDCRLLERPSTAVRAARTNRQRHSTWMGYCRCWGWSGASARPSATSRVASARRWKWDGRSPPGPCCCYWTSHSPG